MKTKRNSVDSTAAYGYVRASTEDQQLTLEAQRDKIMAYCAFKGLTLVDVIIETGVSGGTPLSDRPGGQTILEAIRQGQVRHVVAIKLDRLFRDAVDCLNVVSAWDKSGVTMHLIEQSVDTSSAMGRFFLTILAGFAEMERNVISERTSAVLQHKASKGEYTGGEAPYGWQVSADGVNLTPNPVEQETVKTAKSLSESGLSLRKIGTELESRGYFPRSGNQWYPSSVKSVINAKLA